MKFTSHYSDIPSILSSALSDNPSVSDGAILAVPKKPYLSYPVTPEWISDVKTQLRTMPRGAQTRMLEHINARLRTVYSTGHLSDILSGKYETSDIVGPVHEFLGWSEPLPPTTSRDAGELVHIYGRLTKEQRARLSARADQIKDMSGDEARDLLAQILMPPPKK